MKILSLLLVSWLGNLVDSKASHQQLFFNQNHQGISVSTSYGRSVLVVQKHLLGRSFVVTAVEKHQPLNKRNKAHSHYEGIQPQESFHLKLSADGMNIQYIRENMQLRSTDADPDPACIIPLVTKPNAYRFRLKKLIEVGFYLYQPKATQFKINFAKSFDTNVVVDVAYFGESHDSVLFNIMLLPEQLMTPRALDPMIGYQVVTVTKTGVERVMRQASRDKPDTAKDELQHYITRFNLEGSITRMVANTIDFYVDPKVDVAYHGLIHEVVREWNRAFREAGYYQYIIKCHFYSALYAWPLTDIDDNRYNTITVNTKSQQRMSLPIRNIVDPRTGQILSSKISIHSSDYKMYSQEKVNLLNFAMKYTEGSSLFNFDEEYAKIMFLQFRLFHDFGHALGLKDNFVGSRKYSPSQLQNRPPNGLLSSTIMDILPLNLWTKMLTKGDPLSFEQLVQLKLGEYDFQAIAYGYQALPDENTHYALSQLANGAVYYGESDIQPNHVKVVFDLSDDPGAFYLDRIKLVAHFQNLQVIIDDDDQVLLNDIIKRATTHLITLIGGFYPISRNTRPLPVPRERQQQALEQVLKVANGENGIFGNVSDPFTLYQKEVLTLLINRMNYVLKENGRLESTQILEQIRKSVWHDGSKGYCPDERLLSHHIKCLELLCQKREFSLAALGLFELNSLVHHMQNFQVAAPCKAIDMAKFLRRAKEILAANPLKPGSQLKQANDAFLNCVSFLMVLSSSIVTYLVM